MGERCVYLSWTVELRDDASWIARSLVTEALAEVASPPTVANAALLTGELVTNVMMHTPDERIVVSLSFDHSVRHLRVGVTDFSPSLIPAIVPDRPPNVVGGFGLMLVEGLAEEWGSDLADDHKTVWFRLQCTDA